MKEQLQIKNVSFRFSETPILNDITLEVSENEIISLIGKSGCGKTTLLNLISGLLKKEKGVIAIEGRETISPNINISYLTQSPTLLPYRTSFENATLSLELRNQLNTESENKVLEFFNLFGLSDAKDKFPSELSGGMKQRVGIIQSISANALIYLLDEPFSAIDKKTSKIIEDTLWNKIKNENSSMIIVTHDLEQAISLSDRIIVLSSNPGKIFKQFDLHSNLKELKPSERNNHPDFPKNLFELVKIFSEL